MKTILAIDPGASGGIAVKHGNAKPFVIPMPETEGDICAFLFEQLSAATMEGFQPVAVIEHQVGVRGPGAARAAGNMFQFGEGYGFIKGALQATHWRLETVRPQAWIKALSLGSKKSHVNKTAWKNHLKAAAQRLYPDIKVTLSTADALLLLEWATKADGLAAPVFEFDAGDSAPRRRRTFP